MSTEIDFSWIRGFFRISPEGAEEPMLELPGTDLLDGSKLLPALEAAGRIVRATGLELPASFAGLTLCNLCAVSLIVKRTRSFSGRNDTLWKSCLRSRSVQP